MEFIASITDDDESSMYSQCKCSYALSGDTLMHQAVYVCNTCFPDDANNNCCCVACIDICHANHDTDFIGYGRAYCDCGKQKCSLVTSSVDEARRVMEYNPLKQISLDAEGRVASTAATRLTIHDFNVHNIIHPPDSALYRNLSAQSVQIISISKDTFWLEPSCQPRCSLEAMVMRIFKHHTRGTTYTSGGAEWWLQVKDTATSDTSNCGGIGLHYDKDEEVAASFNVGIFPQISTVTYLTESRNFSPTVVFRTTAASPVGAPIDGCWISYGSIGKHIAFDGRYLHGAPSNVFTGDADANDQLSSGMQCTHRITLLVNIWIDHHPVGVNALPIEIISHIIQQQEQQQIESDMNAINNIIIQEQPTNTCTEEKYTVTYKDIETDGSSSGDYLYIPFVTDETDGGKRDDEAGIVLRMWMPDQALDQAWHRTSDGLTQAIRYTDADSAIVLQYEETGEDEFVEDLDGNMLIE